MKKFCKIVILLIINCYYLNSQETIELNQGKPISVDGILSENEWDDANSVNLVSAGGKIVKVLFKHDGENLLFAFLDNLGSANYRFPEILLDINNDKSSNWLNDDWWFHVSNTNCFNRGNHSVYNTNTCKTVQPTWQANNFNVSLPDTVEIKIPFNVVELDTSKKTIGIAFDVTNTYSAWEFYPSSANINAPGTWLNANINFNISHVANKSIKNNMVNVYPNPLNNSASFQYNIINRSWINLEIYDLLGNKIASLVNEEQDSGNYLYNFDFTQYPSGKYFYKFIIDGKLEAIGEILVNK